MKARHWTVAVIFIIGILWIGSAWAKEEIKLSVATKPGSAQNVCAERFKKLLESRSSYRVRIYDNNSLGNETDILKKVQKNDIQMGIVTSSPFDAFIPEVRVLDYPFLFESPQQADRILDGPPGQELLARLEKAGFKGLAFSENGFRHLTNNKRPIHSVGDVEGLKIRVMESLIQVELWNLIGAKPVALGWPINAELRKKTVDAQENPLSVIWTYKLNKLQKYLTLTGHVYSPHIDVANLTWFNGLPPSDRDLIAKCMHEAALYQREWNRNNVATFLARLKKAGMKVVENPDLASFRNRVSRIQDMDPYREKNTRELLQMFLSATVRDSSEGAMPFSQL